MQAKTRLIAPWLLLIGAIVGCEDPAAESPVRPVRALKVGDTVASKGDGFPAARELRKR